MSDQITVALTPHSTGQADPSVDRIFEYYSDLNALSVLNEALGQPTRRRLVHVDIPGKPPATSVRSRELSRLDDVDRSYLEQRRVHELPPTQARLVPYASLQVCSSCAQICNHESWERELIPVRSKTMLLLFFRHVFPYTPVLNREQLVREHHQGNSSTFLLYSIFAITVPYASLDLVQSMGFSGIVEAQKEFFTRARLLYDFGCEKSQLYLLQGCVYLSSFQNSFAPSKDFRFWFHNAVRIATRLGFHRK